VPNGNNEKLGIQSAEVAAELLSALADLDKRAPLKDVAQRAGLHPAKAHRYLVSLVRTGLAAQDLATGHYGLGPLAMRVGLAALSQNDVVGIATEHLAVARASPAYSVLLSIWGGHCPVIVRRLEDARSPVYRNASVGSGLPLFNSATGLTFAAFLPGSHVEALLAEEVQRIPNASVAQEFVDDRMSAIIDVRQKGFACIRGSYVAETASLAAPIFDLDGHVTAVVAVVGRSVELAGDSASDVDKLLTCTLQITRAIGGKVYSPNAG